ncbi:SURF1 family protein [Agromyces aerolatus]|uniref:SURF1 family protein n=1 Tax=Agromyces sp. LY-1074 TaxID=3074080 RepID=UPI00285C5531|nr:MULTISPECIES: SURF1 family protein [unclassified Agromyces]MDR5698326.1 SURF1 family protein [Agromyces sp. LY-1074]MDR5704620.1 SURF1 family protein [Agromyces sp. LY-1358]
MLRMMLRPRWVLALLLALGVAAAFAALGQWQIERAVEQASVEIAPTEDVRPFAGLVDPDTPTSQLATGQMVEVTGRYVAGDTVLVDGRLNDGEAGTWVVAHLEVTDGPAGGLPVAIGWAAERDDAQAVLDRFDALTGPDEVTITGRFLPSEAPMLPEDDADPHTMQTVAVAQLINLWADYDDQPVYFGYVTAADPVDGLVAISSPPPEQAVEVNWLNIFYAVEWALFAGFAVYLWYRLVRDAVEREREEAAEAAEQELTAPTGT